MPTNENQASHLIPTTLRLPATPAAKCFHHIRLANRSVRGDLIRATGLSQPTITRAVAALLKHQLVHERRDLTRASGPGRPTIPIELAPSRFYIAGVTIDADSTYLALYDVAGRPVREGRVNKALHDLPAEDHLEYIVAGIHRLLTGLSRPLASIGVACAGYSSPEGAITLPGYEWFQVPVATRLADDFQVPVTVSPAVSALAAAEQLHAPLPAPKAAPLTTTLTLFAGESVGAARLGQDQTYVTRWFDSVPSNPELARELSLHRFGDVVDLARRNTKSGLKARSLLDERAERLGDIVGQLVECTKTDTVVLTGSAFSQDESRLRQVTKAIHRATEGQVSLRTIPTHRDTVRAASQAVALDRLVSEPLAYNVA